MDIGLNFQAVDSTELTHSALAKPWVEWLASAPGEYALRWQQARFDAVVPNEFGFHAVQMGLPGLNPLSLNRMPHRLTAYLPGEWGLEEPAIRTSGGPDCSQLLLDTFEELPIDSESVDLVILPHVLEFSRDPHQVLREVDRILVPGGRVMISGFNPVSLLGAQQALGQWLGPVVHRLPQRITRPFTPVESKFISVPRLKDWFKLLSFEMSAAEFGFFAPLCETPRWLSRWQFMEKLGDRFWPICGGVYFVTGIKQVTGMRLVGPTWKRKKSKVGATTTVPAGRVPSYHD